MAAPRGRQITNFGSLFDPFAIGTGLFTIVTPTPARRVLATSREAHSFAIVEESRVGVLSEAARSLAVDGEDRLQEVGAEGRTLSPKDD